MTEQFFEYHGKKYKFVAHVLNGFERYATITLHEDDGFHVAVLERVQAHPGIFTWCTTYEEASIGFNFDFAANRLRELCELNGWHCCMPTVEIIEDVAPKRPADAAAEWLESSLASWRKLPSVDARAIAYRKLVCALIDDRTLINAEQT